MALDGWGEDHLGRMLVDAVGDLTDRLGDDAPARIAEALVARLAVEGKPADRPSWLLDAAALVRPGAVDVCHAGDLRVQLVRDGAVIASTIDHTLGNQPGGTGLACECRRALAPARRPSCRRATWPLGGGRARLIIASPEVHGHRPSVQLVGFPDATF